MWSGSARIGYCTLYLPADWFLCRAAAESTKYVIAWISPQAQEITNGYLMNWLDFNISLQHAHIHMWEEEMGAEGKSCWSRNKCALSHHQSLKLDHRVYNVNSYEGILFNSKVLHILSSITTVGEINVIVLYVCRDTKIRLSICCR